MSDNEKILSLAKKLKALADRGVGGEKENAVTMLQSLMKKHNITMDMINENDAKDHEFIVPKGDPVYRKFFIQVIASVLGKGFSWGTYKRSPKGKERWCINCTASEAIEIQAKINFFYKIWEEEMDIFYSAFIQKNHLWAKEIGEEKEEEKQLSPEEKKKLWKMMTMMEGMERHVFAKQIGNKK